MDSRTRCERCNKLTGNLHLFLHKKKMVCEACISKREVTDVSMTGGHTHKIISQKNDGYENKVIQ